MGKIIELQEVKELQTRFDSNAEELNQHFESLVQKIGDFIQIDSFQGKAADGIKGYLSTVHGKVISGYMASAELLKEQFQKTIDDFNNTVDSDADAKIYGSYLEDVKKKINGYSEEFNQSNEEAQKTVGTISDIVAIQYPSSSGITEGIAKSRKAITDTLEKLETYNSKQNDLQNFHEMMRALDEGMNQIRTNGGDFSSDSIEKIMSSKWYETISNGTVGDEGDILDILKTLASKGAVITGKLGFVLGTLSIVPNAKRGGLVGIQKGFLTKVANGKIASVWEKMFTSINSAVNSSPRSKKLFGKVTQEFSTIEKAAAKIGNLNHSLPNNSIKTSNLPKHMIKNMKPFGVGGLVLGAGFEVNELTSALKSDTNVGQKIVDVGYSVLKVGGTSFFSWAGAVAGAEAGAIAGSFIPGIGTAVGAIAGGIIGATAGGTSFSTALQHFAPRKKFKEYALSCTNAVKKWFK